MTTRVRGPYVFGEEIFNTKKEATHFIQDILHRYQLHEALAPRDYDFMLAVLAHHPNAVDKFGVGIKTIHVEEEKVWRKRQFIATRLDGSRTDFSFMKCLHPASKLQLIKKACRDLISSDIMQFRYRYFADAGDAPCRCPISGESMTRLDAHVDHAPPLTFDILVDQFLWEEGIDIDSVPLTGFGDGEMRKGFADSDLEARWKKFHRAHAKLRVVSGAANLSTIKRNRVEAPGPPRQ